ncbi:NAD-dependent epimerase/dehydratase family protein [Aeromonas veronii bv. sobria]|uniref:NAD-dependent epimerase/dehydratase family protein n=1 Tax=Aeromonas veronii TaxID=654 RepID=UPI0035C01700
MNILITGGAGFIGSSIALKLILQGHFVRIIDTLSPQIHGTDPDKTSPLYQSISDKTDFILGSVCDRALMLKAINGIDTILHLAAETGTGQSMYEIQRYVDVNIGGTALLLDILANNHHCVKKIVVASSRSIYGEGKYQNQYGEIIYPGARSEHDMLKGQFEPVCEKTGVPLTCVATDEESKIHPSSVYGITKQNQEQMVMTVCPTIGIAPVALRYQNVYGPGQSLSNPYTGILSIFSTRIKNANSISIFEDGKESRDFVYIDDVADATIAAMMLDSANGEIFGIGSGQAIDVLTVAQSLVNTYGINVDINITGQFRLGDIRHNYADISKAKRLIGFSPIYDFNAGIKLFTSWVNAQDIKHDNYEKSVEEMKARGLFK